MMIIVFSYNQRNMLAPGTQSPSVIDSLNGSMEEWYDAVDASIKKSDVIPGNYEYTINTSYGNVGRIVEGSSTHFDISCDRFKVISLENSYITLKQTVTINIPINNNANNAMQQWYYIGYKSAFDAISQYRIYSNSDHLQTQNHANYEWFMIYNSIPDDVKENSDVFATYKKINERNPFVPGTYLKLSNNAVVHPQITFDVRIPLNSFLMLYNLKYFPDWGGKLTLEVYPSYKNIVIAPIIGSPQVMEASDPTFHNNAVAAPTNLSGMYYNPNNDNSVFNFGFSNINQANPGNTYNIGNNNVHTPANFVITCNGDGCFVEDCKIRLATYLLKVQVATALAAKYASVPLIFPIQTTQIKDFTSELAANQAGVHFTTANTIALKHCDAMFLVFRNGPYATTCFNNPYLSNFRVNVDGKFYPREELATFNDRRFINLTLDALNLNNGSASGISKDLATSLQPFTTYRNYINAVGNTITKWVVGDGSNFMIGIPFCDSDDFMGGLSTVGTVQIELSGIRDGTGAARSYLVTAICFEDCYLKIRSIKPDGRSQIEITNATIEQMALGGL